MNVSPRLFRSPGLLVYFGLFLLLEWLPAHGAAVTWTTSGSGVVDGSGNWTSGAASWWNGSAATTWSNGSDAVLGAVGGSSGTVTVSGFTPVVDNILFNQGYTLTGGTIQCSGTTLDSSANTSGTAYSVVTVASGKTATINSILSSGGTGGLSVNAAGGELILGTGNTFTGGVLLNSGTLGFFEGPNLGATPSSVATQLEFAGNSTLQATANITTALNYHRGLLIDNGVTATFDTQGFTVLLNDGISAQSGQTGVLNKIGSGTLYLGNDNSSSNANPDQDDAYLTVVMTSGTLELNKGASGAHSVGGGGLTVNGGGVQLTGTTGDQIYDGAPVTVNGGTFDMDGKSETIGSLNAGASGGTVTNSGSAASALTIGGNAGATGAGTYAGTITDNTAGGGTLALAKGGSGTLTLSASNNYTGGTTISGGAVSIGADNNLGASASQVVLGGGTLAVTSNISAFTHVINTGSTGGTINVASGKTLQINNYDANGSHITGSGSITVMGGGQLSLSSTSDASYSGNWTISAGLVEVQDNGSQSLGTGSITLGSAVELSDAWGKTISNAIVSNGGTLSFDNASGGAYSGPITLNNNTTAGMRDFYNTGAPVSGSMSGPVSGSGGLIITGGGTLALSGSDGYTGATAVNAGIVMVTGSLTGTHSVAVNNAGSMLTLGASNVLNSAATLSLSSGTFNANGFSQTLGNLTSTGSSTLTLGTGASILAFASSSGNTWTGTLTIQNWSGSSAGGGADEIFFGSSASGLSGGEVADIVFVNPTVNGVAEAGSFAGTMLSTGELVAAVPEPGTLAAMAFGFAILTLGSLRRRAR